MYERTVPACHPDREHVARGLCSACYQRWKVQNLSGYKEKVYARTRVYLREHGAAYKAKYKASNAEERERLLDKFERKCGICRSTARKLVLDHDHKTGVIRGVLCMRCNSALGMFEDNVTWLKAAINYLGDCTPSPGPS